MFESPEVCMGMPRTVRIGPFFLVYERAHGEQRPIQLVEE